MLWWAASHTSVLDWRQRRNEWLLNKVTKESVCDHGTLCLQSTCEAQTLLQDPLLHHCCPTSRSWGRSRVGVTLRCPHSLSAACAAQQTSSLGQTVSKKVPRMVVLLPWEDCSFSLKLLPLRFGKLWVFTSSNTHSCFQKFCAIEAVELRSGPIP